MKKDKNSIAVIGQGFVGGSLTQVFSERGFIVYTCDKKGISAPGSYNGSVWSLKSMVDFAERVSPTKDHCFLSTYFVCVPTPMRKTGAADLSIVESVLQELANIPGERVAVVKSTVPPGSTDAWNKRFNESGLTVVFCPEFLTEANALEDMRNQTRIIVGGPRPASSRVKDVFRRAFPDTPIIKTGSTTAEMVKYFTNSFLSTKVSFANEIYQICESLNIDYDKVVEYALYDERIGKTHLSVPGPDGSLGFGGHCVKGETKILCSLKNNNLLSLPEGTRVHVGIQELADLHAFHGQEGLSDFRVRSMSYNGTEEDEKKIRNIVRNDYKGKFVRISFEGKVFECTEDHLVPVLRDDVLRIVKAIEIQNTDKLYVIE